MPPCRSWKLRSLGGRYIVIRRPDLAPNEVPLLPGVAWSLIERVLANPSDANDLVNLSETLRASGVSTSSGLNRSALQRAVLSGVIVLVLSNPPAPLREPSQPSRESVADQILTARTAKTWVEMELVDAAGGPVGGMRVVCMLPDGEIREGSLDARGRIRFDGIEPGNCVFRLPDLDRDTWERAL